MWDDLNSNFVCSKWFSEWVWLQLNFLISLWDILRQSTIDHNHIIASQTKHVISVLSSFQIWVCMNIPVTCFTINIFCVRTEETVTLTFSYVLHRYKSRSPWPSLSADWSIIIKCLYDVPLPLPWLKCTVQYCKVLNFALQIPIC